MLLDKTSVWETKSATQLASVLCSIDNPKTMQNFLRDVLTEKEIIEVSARLEAAKMLDNSNKYNDIIEKTKLSSRTIARISDWMRNGCGGYNTALNIINHHGHVLPARAE